MPLAAKIRKQVAQHTRHAVERWREWAVEIAAGSGSPRPAEVIAAAAVLGITDPGLELERDAAAAAEHASYTRAVESCRRDKSQKIAAAGGIDKTETALAAAKAEVARLEALLDDLRWPHESHWNAALVRLERAHPRLFDAEWPRPRPEFTDEEVLSDDR